MFIHLNLAVSLLVGYLVFMIGIETATSSTVSIELKASNLNLTFVNHIKQLHYSENMKVLSTIVQGGCAFVAALLHYFFLAAFCWMLCEGVMLYLMLVVVFSNFLKRWWFFLILGWGRCFLKS